MKLEDQFTAAMLAAGNKRSSIKSYWPHVVGFIQFTRQRYGNWVHPSETKVEDAKPVERIWNSAAPEGL